MNVYIQKKFFYVLLYIIKINGLKTLFYNIYYKIGLIYIDYDKYIYIYIYTLLCNYIY